MACTVCTIPAAASTFRPWGQQAARGVATACALGPCMNIAQALLQANSAGSFLVCWVLSWQLPGVLGHAANPGAALVW